MVSLYLGFIEISFLRNEQVTVEVRFSVANSEMSPLSHQPPSTPCKRPELIEAQQYPLRLGSGLEKTPLTIITN